VKYIARTAIQVGAMSEAIAMPRIGPDRMNRMSAAAIPVAKNSQIAMLSNVGPNESLSGRTTAVDGRACRAS